MSNLEINPVTINELPCVVNIKACPHLTQLEKDFILAGITQSTVYSDVIDRSCSMRYDLGHFFECVHYTDYLSEGLRSKLRDVFSPSHDGEWRSRAKMPRSFYKSKTEAFYKEGLRSGDER